SNRYEDSTRHYGRREPDPSDRDRITTAIAHALPKLQFSASTAEADVLLSITENRIKVGRDSELVTTSVTVYRIVDGAPWLRELGEGGPYPGRAKEYSDAIVRWFVDVYRKANVRRR